MASSAAICTAAAASSMWIAATLFSFTEPSNFAAVPPGSSETRSSGTSAEITTRRGA